MVQYRSRRAIMTYFPVYGRDPTDRDDPAEPVAAYFAQEAGKGGASLPSENARDPWAAGVG